MISYKAGHINLTKWNHRHKQPSCTILRSDLHCSDGSAPISTTIEDHT